MATVSYAQLIRRNRDFRLFWGGQIVSQLGDWFSLITVQALLLQYTGSAAALAGYMLASMLPGFLLSPIAGMIVDHLPRKAVMIAADAARAFIALGLLAMRGPETVWIGYLCVAGLSTFAAFFEPARIATIPNITARDELVTANALSSVTWSILLTSGALVGGIIGRYFGPQTAFVLNSLSFVGSALFLSGMRVPPTHREAGQAGGFRAIGEGFRYVGRHREIAGALSAKLGWGVAGGIQILIPIYGARVFPLPGDRAGQLGMSLLMAASGLGTALGPIVARRWTGGDPGRIRWAIAGSFLAGGLYYVCLAAAPSLAAAGVLLFLARFHGAIIWVFSTVLLQMLTADEYRGRVFSSEMALFTGTMMLSSVGTAQALDHGWADVHRLTAVMGLISLVCGAFWIGSLARGRARLRLAQAEAGGEAPG